MPLTVRASLVDTAGEERYLNLEVGYVPGMCGTLLSPNRLASSGTGFDTLSGRCTSTTSKFRQTASTPSNAAR